jgi:Cell wall binding domain 2 (CWB2)
VRAERPINADAPAQEPSPKPERRSRRPSLPLIPTLLAVAVLIAVGFVLAAVLGGSGGSEETSVDSPAPAPATAPADSEPTAAQTAEQLGYPSFATVNTTRVGGSDPAANAAAVALAAFPSTTDAQRPAAVTLVGEDDWAGAIAASVLMSAPVRAPVLVSGPDEIPEATEEALAALDPEGDESTGGSSAFAIGDVAARPGKLTRVPAGAAASQAARIAALRDRLFGSPPNHVVVAPSARPQLAMPAAAWAARSGDPVLYASPNRLPGPTVAALKRHPKVPVYILGPSSAISAKVSREIAKLGPKVKRVSGKDPVANAVAFARYADGDFGWDINDPGHGFVLARDESPLDAAAAAPLSASGTWGPLLLTDDPGTLPAAVRDYLLDVKPGYTTDPTRAFYNHVWVVGDQEAIDVSQQAEVSELAELARIGGEG